MPVTRLAHRLRGAASDAAASLDRAVRATTAQLADLGRRLRGRPAGRSKEPRMTASHAAPATTGARRLAWRLSIAVAGLMAAASATGLAWRGLYQDPAATAAMFRAYDVGSLAVATPVLAGALARARQGSPRADLLWAGMLAYVVYTYAYYVFGAAFNALFLVHVALFVLGTAAFVLAGGRGAGRRRVGDRPGRDRPSGRRARTRPHPAHRPPGGR
jgi:hypothetical protein